MKKLAATDAQEKLAVADAKLGQVIKKKFEIDCVFESQCAVAFLHADAAFLARGHLATFVRAWLK